MSADPGSKGSAMSLRRMPDTAALNEANRNILLTVRDSSEGELEWEFFCECGNEGCHERVFLRLDDFIALHDQGEPVLAEGHQPSQVERARRLRSEAEALAGQAGHQVKRAERNLRERLRIPGVRPRRP